MRRMEQMMLYRCRPKRFIFFLFEEPKFYSIFSQPVNMAFKWLKTVGPVVVR